MVFGGFFSWWGSQLAGLLPERLRQREDRGPALIADAVPSGEIQLWLRRGRSELPTRAPARGGRPRPVALRVPDGVVLERPVTLPIAAEPELPRVVAFEIDRISPFALAEVASAYRIESRDKAAGKLQVRVALLPRMAVGPALGRLRSMGLDPTTVLAPRAGGGSWNIPLAAQAGRARASLHRPIQLATAACVLLAAATAATPFVLQQRALATTEAEITRLRPAVEQAAELRRRLATSAAVDPLMAEAERVGHVMEMAAALTAVLPDDAYLTTLTIRQRVMSLSGRSGSAARLIPLLAAEPSFRGAAFAAPVTRVEGARGDVFSIRTEFGP